MSSSTGPFQGAGGSLRVAAARLLFVAVLVVGALGATGCGDAQEAPAPKDVEGQGQGMSASTDVGIRDREARTSESADANDQEALTSKAADDQGPPASKDAKAKGARRRATRTIRIRELKTGVVGGVQTHVVKPGTRVRIVVMSDFGHVVHLSLHEEKRVVKPGHPARFSFVAGDPTSVMLDSHRDFDRGGYQFIATVEVAP